MKKWILTLLFLTGPLHALEKVNLGVMYYNQLFGNLRQDPNEYSSVVTTFSCGHPITKQGFKLNSGQVQELFSGKWVMVKTGPYDGYIHRDFLSKSKPKCLQDKYPNFFIRLELSVTDTFYWGQLADLYIRGEADKK